MFFKNLQTKQIQMMSVILLISVSIVACGSQRADPPIIDTEWHWSEMVETEPASQSLVPTPENYTMVFASDGSVSIKADCNMVGGSYSLDGNNLTIEFGPSTMAFCGEESLDQLFLGFVSNVGSYSVEDGRLVLELKDGAGQMTFDEG